MDYEFMILIVIDFDWKKPHLTNNNFTLAIPIAWGCVDVVDPLFDSSFDGVDALLFRHGPVLSSRRTTAYADVTYHQILKKKKKLLNKKK